MKCFVCKNATGFTKLFPKYTDTENYICEECGLVFIPRKDDQFSEYYKSDGYYKESPNIAAKPFFTSKSMLISLADKKVATINSLLDKKIEKLKVLDVGCGYGELLYVLKNKYKCEVLGIEPSKTSATIGSKMFDIEIKSVLLSEYKEETKFDLIICKHTLEHLEDPIMFLTQLKGLLSESGRLYVEVPNILHPSGGFDLKTFLYYEHLQTFSTYTLFKLLKLVDLNVIAYQDNYFLEFVCGTDTPGLKIEQIPSTSILEFLNLYKSKYNFFNVLKVYFGKFQYLVELIWNKIKDLLNGR